MFNKAYFKGADKESGKDRIIIVYQGDQGEEEVKNYYITSAVTQDWIEETARREIKLLNNVKNYVKELIPGEIDLTEPAPKEESEKNIFNKKYRKLELAKKALALGLPTQPLIDSLIADLKKAYKEEFLDYL